MFSAQNIRVYGGEVDEEQEEQFYLQRLEAGLFTLQLVDYIMLEICLSGSSSVSTISAHRFYAIAFSAEKTSEIEWLRQPNCEVLRLLLSVIFASLPLLFRFEIG